MRGGQQSIDNSLIGSGGIVGEKFLNFWLGRRQTDQIKGYSPNEGAFVRKGIGVQADRFEFRANKIINGRLNPGRVLGSGYCNFLNRLKCPMGFAYSAVAVSAGKNRGCSRIGCAAAHPFGEIGNLLIRQLAPMLLRWHTQIWISVANSLDECALLGFAWYEHAARFAAAPHGFARIQ